MYSVVRETPVEWLLDNHQVDERWCLVHATHLNEHEISALAQSRAIVGLCPTTEANLGDGIFPMTKFLEKGGNIAIGSDSNVSVSPVEELRWLEYGQRLAHQSRNVAASEQHPHTAERLFRKLLSGGASATGRSTGKIAQGCRADILVLDDNSAILTGKPMSSVLDAFAFSGNENVVRDVMTGGKWVVQNYRHENEETIARKFHTTITSLQSKLK